MKLPLFLNVRSQSTGRDALYREALDFEKAWAKADAAWIFKLGLPLTTFKGARELITVKQADYAEAVKHEQGERAVLHTLAEAVNEVSVDWYQVATAHFAEFTTEGQLIRTIPTTYDPSQPPGKLSFLQLLTPAPNEVHLIWRAPRGQRSYIQAQAPGATDFSTILDGVSQTEWIGMGLAAGLWRFKGKATNQHGEGAESEMVEVLISAAQAA